MNISEEPLAAAVADFTAARDRMLVAWAIYRTDRDDIRKLYRYVRTIRATDRLSRVVQQFAAVRP